MIKISTTGFSGSKDSAGMHIPVMPQEVLSLLNAPVGGCLLDCTMGMGGHASLLMERIGAGGHYIGLDRDAAALARAHEQLSGRVAKLDLRQSDFRNFDQVLQDVGVTAVDGMIFDLGISSFQLDNPERGFSFMVDGPLDMRMDQQSFISAYDLVNSLSEEELARVLKNFGEERYHHRIAHFLVAQRQKAPITSTRELSEMVMRAMPRQHGYQKIHPATRTFQAIRIAVNRELEALDVALDKCANYLKIGGRVAVIAFHSLEDRIVKNKFRDLARAGRFHLIVKKPVRPSEEEVRHNSRARSARLRVAERIA